jgi:hypothetical protein
MAGSNWQIDLVVKRVLGEAAGSFLLKRSFKAFGVRSVWDQPDDS